MNIYRDSAIKYSRDNIPTLSGRLGFLKYHKILVTAETQKKTLHIWIVDEGKRIKAVPRMNEGSLCLIRSRFAEKKKHPLKDQKTPVMAKV